MNYILKIIIFTLIIILKIIIAASEDCADGFIKLNVNFKTDNNPEQNSWLVTKLLSGEISMQSDIFSERQTWYNSTECLEDESYLFTLFETWTGIEIYGAYEVRVNDYLIKYELGPFSSFITRETVICSKDSECKDKSDCTIDTCNFETKQCLNTPNSQFSSLCRTYGNPLGLILRVKAQDSEVSASMNSISEHAFGDSNNYFSMSTQLSACSYNKFNIVPFNGVSSTGLNITNGVTEIELERNIQNEQAGLIAGEVLSKAKEELGDLETQFDFVLVCLPPGTLIGVSSTWKAYAFTNSYESIYNDQNCLFPSVLLHEIGHNVGLSHANTENKNYEDQTGYMGISYNCTSGPKKCYNGAQSWDLGWYLEGHENIDVKTMQSYSFYYLVGLADYENKGSKSVIIKIINAMDGYDYFVTFNRGTSFNSESQKEGINKVLISRKRMGGGFEDSVLVDTLGNNEVYIVNNVEEHTGTLIELDLWISALLYIDNFSPPHAFVQIQKKPYSSCTEDSWCDDGNYCTIDKCEITSFHHSRKACTHYQKSCSECGAFVSIGTSFFGDKSHVTSWTLINAETKNVVKSSGYYEDLNISKNEQECLQYGKYLFALDYFHSDNEVNSAINSSLANENIVYFNLSVGDTIIDYGNISHDEIIESFFIICSSDNDCHDYDGCSIDYCDLSTNLCNNTDKDCADCSWFSVNITTDNYPEETTWSLLNLGTNDEVMSGNPYLFDLATVYGRRSKPTKSGRRSKPTRSGRRSKPTKLARKQAPTRILRSSSTIARNIEEDYSVLNQDAEHDSIDDNIYKEMCLENKNLYHFVLNDNFGDGICCAEGEGKYTISADGNVIHEGGNFSTTEEYLFMFKNCSTDLECSDSSYCTTEKCIPSASLCVLTRNPCHSCGGFVSVNLLTDFEPNQNKWIILKRNVTEMLGGPFAGSSQLYVSNKCLTFGSYKFHIFDSFGNGMTKFCLHCGYNLSINNELVIQGDEEFGFEEELTFGVCSDDIHCNDYDGCTRDFCDIARKICVFEPLPCSSCSPHPCDHSQTCIPSPCSECNAKLVTVSLTTDRMPEQNSWKVIDSSTNDTMMDEGPFYKSNHIYSMSNCLPEGNYEFLLFDSYSNGMTLFCLSNTGVSCGYNVVVDNETIITGDGNYQFEELRKEFDIQFQTKVPEILWHIEFEKGFLLNDTWKESAPYHQYFQSNLTGFINDDGALKSLLIEYQISPNKVLSQLQTSIYSTDCVMKSNSSTIKVIDKAIIPFHYEDLDSARVIIDFDEIHLQNSLFWKATSETSGLIQFCLKTELLLEDSGLSVSFIETDVLLEIDLQSNFEIVDVALHKEAVSMLEENAQFKVQGCICNNELSCLPNPVIAQNSAFGICVSSFDKNLEVAEFISLAFYQNDIEKYTPIVNKIADDLTSTKSGRTGIVNTRMVSNFYQVSIPSPVQIKGEVHLTFPSTTTRTLRERQANYQTQQSEFILFVDLKPVEIDDDDNTNTFIIVTVSAISAVSVIVLFVFFHK